MNKNIRVIAATLYISIGAAGALLAQTILPDAVAGGVTITAFPENSVPVYAHFKPIITETSTPDGDGGVIVTRTVDYGVEGCAVVPSDDPDSSNATKCTKDPFVPKGQAAQNKYQWCTEQAMRAVLKERNWLDGGIITPVP